MERKAKLNQALQAVRTAFETQEEELLTAHELIQIISGRDKQIPVEKMLALAGDLTAGGHPLASRIPRWPSPGDEKADVRWAYEAQSQLYEYLASCLRSQGFGLRSDD